MLAIASCTLFNSPTYFFYKQPLFLLQPRVAKCRMNFQPESFLAVAYSIHFQTLPAQQLLIFNKLMLPSFALIRGISCI